MNTKQTGLFIAKKRKEKKMTQSELAEILQVTDKAISRWETGEGYPEVTILPKLAYTLGVSVDEILNGDAPEGCETTSVKIVALFEMMSRTAFAFTLLGLLIGIGLIYLTEDKYVSLIPLAIGWFMGFILYQYAKYQFIKQAVYNDLDKFVVYSQSKLQIISLISVIAILLPQFVLKFIIDSMGYGLIYPLQSDYIDFLSFMWSSIVFLLISIPVSLLVIRLYKSITYKHERITHNKAIYRTLMIALFLYIIFFFGFMGYEFVWGTIDQIMFFIPIVVLLPNIYLTILDKKGGINLLIALVLSAGLVITGLHHDQNMPIRQLIPISEYFEYSFGFFLVTFIGSLTMMIYEVKTDRVYNERFFSYLRNVIITIAFVMIFLTYSVRAMHAYVGFITLPMILLGFGFELILRNPKYLKTILLSVVVSLIIPLGISFFLPILNDNHSIWALIEGFSISQNGLIVYDYAPNVWALLPIIGLMVSILVFTVKHIVLQHKLIHVILDFILSILALAMSIFTIFLSIQFAYDLSDLFPYDLFGLSVGGYLWIASAIMISVVTLVDAMMRLKKE